MNIPRAVMQGLFGWWSSTLFLAVLVGCGSPPHRERTSAHNPEVSQAEGARTASCILAALWPTSHSTFELLRSEDGPMPRAWGFAYGTGGIDSLIVIFVPKDGATPFIALFGAPPQSRVGWNPEICPAKAVIRP
jgi:hypothetical protein